MILQPRRVEAANKILSGMVPFAEWCPAWQAAVNELANALAEAENRAAWDVVDAFYDVLDTQAYTNAKYGPRPSRGEVKHE